MRTKRNILYGILLIFVIVITGCTKEETFYELEKEAVFPYNTDNFESAAISMYASCFITGRYAWEMPVSQVWMIKDIGGDDLQWLQTGQSNINHKFYYYRSPDISDPSASSLFSQCYSAVANINTTLDFFDQNDGTPFNPANISEKYKANILRVKGEALFLRSYMYYLLTGMFSPWPVQNNMESDVIIPFRQHFPGTYSEAVTPEKGTVKQMYGLMISDLKSAKDLLPEKYVAGLHNSAYEIARTNKFVAAGQLARVYFRMNELDSALTELNYIIDSPDSPYNLNQDPKEAWNDNVMTTTTTASDVMWYIPYFPAEFTATGFDVMTSLALGTSWGGYPSWREYTVSYDALSKFSWMADPKNNDYAETSEALLDKRYTQLFTRFEAPTTGEQDPTKKYEPQLDPNIVKTPQIWCSKFFGGVDGKSNPHYNVPIMRFAEMVLTRSIIRFTKGDLEGALSDLNRVRNRAGIGDLQGGVSALTADVIDTERMKEMLFEGDRFDYLRSRGIDIPKGDRDGSKPTDVLTPSVYANYYWPLPHNEIDYTK